MILSFINFWLLIINYFPFCTTGGAITTSGTL